MNEYVKDVPLVFCITDEETFSAVEFPFELIGSYVAVQDIPRYSFGLERKVRSEMAEFKDELAMRKLHQEHQRRPVKRDNLQPMLRAHTSPLSTVSGLSDGGVEPLVRFTLPPLQKKTEETGSRPMTSRIKGLFRSKTRTTPHA
ncbi:hypothetical protein LPJ60_004244 [Coemansia sp. RSA 2675]|uniref:Uncharacterized protein n=2 Tax=Coemansia TaxID=4863 RepID=A0A9W8L428_9FUNG|nr:hypothetical protein LPJ60_004244 [Coemansia sp. RSA 2675]KAJ2416182.1 hypothetical protein GGI10_001163 [Coemansia sp. RSA 2530]KAJ2688843.1 hypothetical protein IWW39_001892 [Coemansia spiralis]KAJ2701446.1 hypothetical protein H4218_001413 [Coemansia sp. IMI 209128]KAJ2785148.1 hypothetical protein GGI18_003371 [Coemansia linderi]